MEFAPSGDDRTSGVTSSNAPNNGVTNFLRHFSTNHHQPRTNNNNKGGSSSSLQHHLKKSNRILRNLGRSNTTSSNTKSSTRREEPVTSPGRVASAFRQHKIGKKHPSADEEMITFNVDSTRLGIRPTCYDVPESYDSTNSSTSGTPNSIDEEIFFLNNNVAAAASVTPLSTTNPNLFSSLPIWEETARNDDSSSPQKSVGSYDSIKSDDSNEEENSKFTFPSSNSPPNDVGGANRSRSNNNHSPSKKISSNLMQKAKSIVQRARDKESHSCDRSQISTSSSIVSKSSNKSRSIGSISTHADTVKIFLLLVEPKSKVFELIQLLYPRNKTKVNDLLKMIPKNATEQALATQVYVGITRPKRRADPITDLQLLASNSVFNTTGQLTAAIESGEIIVAIPELTSTKEIVVLSKQILASAHIQKLISISKGHSSVGSSTTTATNKSGRNKVVKKHRGDHSTRTSSIKSPNHSSSDPSSSSPNYSATFSPIQEHISTKETRSPKIVSFTDENYTEELKRAVENANLANEEAGCSPSVSTTFFLSEDVVTGGPAGTTKTVDFPRDMLDAYMSKDAVLKMCATPNNYKGVPNIECTSSASMVDDTEDTDIDASSCDGSMTSSFHSWAQSLDSTSIPSINRSMGTLMDHGVVATTPKLPIRKKKRFITKKMKRAAMVVLMSSIARYQLDPNGLHTIQNIRCSMLFEPMGLLGFFYFLLTFAMLIKLQKMYFRRQSKRPIVPISRCPVVRFITKIYKQLNREDTTVIHDSKLDDPPYPQSVVPTSIHAIKFG